MCCNAHRSVSVMYYGTGRGGSVCPTSESLILTSVRPRPWACYSHFGIWVYTAALAFFCRTTWLFVCMSCCRVQCTKIVEQIYEQKVKIIEAMQYWHDVRGLFRLLQMGSLSHQSPCASESVLTLNARAPRCMMPNDRKVLPFISHQSPYHSIH